MIDQAKEVPVEVVDSNWLYQTTIDNIKVTVRPTQMYTGHGGYDVQVYMGGIAQMTKWHEDRTASIAAADILRDIYYAHLQDWMLAH